MSENEAKIAFLRRERSYLRVWGRSVAKMIAESDKRDQRHWDLIQEEKTIKHEMSRAARRLRMV